MKIRILLILLGIGLVLIISNFTRLQLANKYYLHACYYDKPQRQDDFPQVFIAIDLKHYYTQLEFLSQHHFSIDTAEVIEYKNENYPILEITKRGVGNNTQAKNKLLVLAGVHGNESGGTLAILELLKQINMNPDKYKKWEIKIMTPVNPAGTLEMSRYNECGCDLNRKMKTSTQKGIIVQRKIIRTYQPEVIISLHEAPSSGFLIHSNNKVKDELLMSLLQNVQEADIALCTEDYLGQKLETPGNSKITGTLKFLNNFFQVQALDDYVSDKEIMEITTESGWNSQDTFQRVNSHVFVINALVENFEKK